MPDPLPLSAAIAELIALRGFARRQADTELQDAWAAATDGRIWRRTTSTAALRRALVTMFSLSSGQDRASANRRLSVPAAKRVNGDRSAYAAARAASATLPAVAGGAAESAALTPALPDACYGVDGLGNDLRRGQPQAREIQVRHSPCTDARVEVTSCVSPMLR